MTRPVLVRSSGEPHPLGVGRRGAGRGRGGRRAGRVYDARWWDLLVCPDCVGQWRSGRLLGGLV